MPDNFECDWEPRDASDWSSGSYQELFSDQLDDDLIGGWDVADSDSEESYHQGPEGKQ